MSMTHNSITVLFLGVIANVEEKGNGTTLKNFNKKVVKVIGGIWKNYF